VEADEADVASATEEGEVGYGLGEFERDGGLRADREVEFAVGTVRAAVVEAQLASYGVDLLKRYARVDVGGAPDAQGVGVEYVRPYDGGGVQSDHEQDGVDVEDEDDPMRGGVVAQ
jgi:hypothetical protein